MIIVIGEECFYVMYFDIVFDWFGCELLYVYVIVGFFENVFDFVFVELFENEWQLCIDWEECIYDLIVVNK